MQAVFARCGFRLKRFGGDVSDWREISIALIDRATGSSGPIPSEPAGALKRNFFQEGRISDFRFLRINSLQNSKKRPFLEGAESTTSELKRPV